MHPEDITMVKVGNFYRVYGKDAYIIAYLFKYKISEENDIMVSGFPTSSIKKVEARLENKKINYIQTLSLYEEEKLEYNFKLD